MLNCGSVSWRVVLSSAISAHKAFAFGSRDSSRADGAKTDATHPVSPDIATMHGQRVNEAREFRVTASVFRRQLATFPMQMAEA